MLRLAVSAFVLLAACPASGQDALSVTEVDQVVDQMTDVILDNFDDLACGDAHCAAASPDERQSRMISAEHRRGIFMSGALSAAAEYCKLDWQRQNFLPMMQSLRAKHGYTVRQAAFAGTLHGTGMTMMAANRPTEPCSPEQRATIVERLKQANESRK